VFFPYHKEGNGNNSRMLAVLMFSVGNFCGIETKRVSFSFTSVQTRVFPIYSPMEAGLQEVESYR